MWTVDVTNKTNVREVVKDILRTEVVNQHNLQLGFISYVDLLTLHISVTVALYKSVSVFGFAGEAFHSARVHL